ncbi:hypothetical protein CK203_062858 [Vitis vinifera]|uniref:Retrovirus-related Pol polyprotein from transposon opus n=1 Tax=Vitis vinifera TaxID=29760 RepID=A0A438FSL6_VITVI|nr:hypothetical protein CK203_062858 [Vitis vinifera]
MIGGKVVEKALLDLGASVNLLPYSVYKQLGLGELKPTSITLSLGDRSVKIPRGIIADVLVQVDNFYYPIDFVVLDTNPIVKEANYVPIILGRPFLATSNAILNFRNGLMQLTFGDMTLELNIFYMPKKLITLEEEEGLEEVCIIDTLVEEHCNKNMQDKLNESLGDLEEGLPKPSDVLATLQGIIYPISDSPWVSPTQVVPKKSGITVVQNEKGEENYYTPHFRLECVLIRKLNVVTRKDHFPLPFIDQVLERVSGHPFYCFLDRCIEKDLVLNWEKCHFMVHQGIVLGHIISEKGIEVDKAKVELIVKLPSPTTVKGVRQFLGHAGLYRRAPNWQLPFEVMCDASDFAIGVVLGQREDGSPIDKKGVENVVADHLSRLVIAHNSHVLPINDDFPEESLMLIAKTPWYAHIANYLVTGEVPSEWKAQDRKHFFAKIHAYYWEEPFLFKYCADQIIRKCVPEEEQQGILSHCHESACEATLPLRKQP